MRQDEYMAGAMPFSIEEENRLKRLHSLAILDTAPEPIFDALTRMASALCETPIALLTMVDAERQWFKSNVGLEGTQETPRQWAFCAHAIENSALMEITDAIEDCRFQNNPLVTGQPKIRFYAGMPIVMSSGEHVGTLCVIDRKPRVLTDLQRAALNDLALVASNALDMRQQALDLNRLNEININK